jgi:hypothetical protein
MRVMRRKQVTELPVHKWVEGVAHPEVRGDQSWPRELLRQRLQLQRERAANRSASS